MADIKFKELVEKAVHVPGAGFVIPADVGRLMVQTIEALEARVKTGDALYQAVESGDGALIILRSNDYRKAKET